MAVTNKLCHATNYQEFEGLSTDVSSLPTDVGVNSKFYALDTNKVYYFDGEDWSEVGGE